MAIKWSETPGVLVSARMQALPICSVVPSLGPWLPCASWPGEAGGLLYLPFCLVLVLSALLSLAGSLEAHSSSISLTPNRVEGQI